MIVAQLRGVEFGQTRSSRYMWPTGPIGDEWGKAMKAVSECAEWLGFKGADEEIAARKYTRALQREREKIFKRAKD